MPSILVVDDHPANCQPLVKLFRFAGLEAGFALSGSEALAKLSTSAPDVVLLDLMMPDRDGFEVLGEIRRQRRLDGVAVLMYTAVVDPECHSRAMLLGAQGYIVKGTSFDQIRAEVHRHLPPDGGQAAGASAGTSGRSAEVGRAGGD
jgi:two-component system OmpR family response regulator